MHPVTMDAWPVSSMVGDSRLDVRFTDCAPPQREPTRARVSPTSREPSTSEASAGSGSAVKGPYTRTAGSLPAAHAHSLGKSSRRVRPRRRGWLLGAARLTAGMRGSIFWRLMTSALLSSSSSGRLTSSMAAATLTTLDTFSHPGSSPTRGDGGGGGDCECEQCSSSETLRIVHTPTTTVAAARVSSPREERKPTPDRGWTLRTRVWDGVGPGGRCRPVRRTFGSQRHAEPVGFRL